MLTARRLATLARLNVRLAGVQRLHDLAAATVDVLADSRTDVVAAAVVAADGTRTPDPGDPRLPTETGPVPSGLRRREQPPRPRAPGCRCAPTTTARRAAAALLLSPMVPVDDDYREFLRLLGFTVSQHLERLDGPRGRAHLSLALQASLLTRPRHSAAFDIAVHYQPAADQWPRSAATGTTRSRAPTAPRWSPSATSPVTTTARRRRWRQVRNLLRGICHLEQSSPAAVVDTLERAMRGLGVDSLASAVVGDLREGPDGGATLTWTNAGHLAPLLLDPDGAVQVLEREPDGLIGLAGLEDRARSDHEVVLPAGSTLLLCTDGLVERRHETLGAGIQRLVEHLSGCQDLSAAAVARHALAVLDGPSRVEDDVALMVVRVRPHTG